MGSEKMGKGTELAPSRCPGQNGHRRASLRKSGGMEVKTGDTCWKDKAEENKDWRGHWQQGDNRETNRVGLAPEHLPRAVLYHS